MPEKWTHIVKEQEGVLLAEKLKQVQQILIDYFQCLTQGRKFKGQGI